MKGTRVLASFLVCMMLATCLVGLPVSATETVTTKTETELLNGYAASVTEDFSASAGTVGYYEYYKYSTSGGKELTSGFTDTATVNRGTAEITGGQLKMITSAKRENVTTDGKGVALSESATAYPCVKYSLTDYIDWNVGQKLTFKVKFDTLGADQVGDAAELQFYTGETRMCLRLTPSQIQVRDSANTKFTTCTHTTGVTYQYLIEFVEGGNTTVVTDDYLKIWRRTSDSDSYTFIGQTAVLQANNRTLTDIISKTGTTVYVDDLVLYEKSSVEEELAKLSVLKSLTFTSASDIVANGSLSTVNKPDISSATVNNNKLELRVSKTGEFTTTNASFYYQYLMSNLDLGDGEYLRIKGAAADTEANDVYFEFDIKNTTTTTGKGTRLRFIANDTNLKGYNTTFSSVAHTEGTTYDYLIQRNGTGTNASYKIWRKVGTETNFTYIGEAAGQEIDYSSAGSVQVKVMNGSGFDLESVQIYGVASDDTPSGGDTPTGTTKTEAEMYADFHYVSAKQDYSSVSIGAQTRADATKVSKVTVDGASAMKVIGHNYEWSTSTPLAEFNIDDAAIAYESPNGMIGIRFKIEGTGNFMFQLRNIDQISLDVKNGKSLSADGGKNSVTTAASGWHEIVAITGGTEAATTADFWYRSGDGDFHYIGQKSVNSNTNTGRLTMRIDDGTTVYIDSITTRVKDVIVTDAAAIAATKGKTEGVAITASEADKELNVAGKLTIGTEDSQNVRRATVIHAGYNKDYGYTTYVNTKDYPTIHTGAETDLADSVDVSALDADVQTALLTDDTLAVLAWDTLHNATTGTGIALCEPVYSKTAGVPANVATGSPAVGQEKSLTAVSKYNAVQLTGYVGKDEMVTAMILDSDGAIKAVGQTTANANGMMDMSISIDPFQNNGGDYTLWYQFGSNAPEKVENVKLYCANDLSTSNITDVTSFVTFVNSFGNDTEKTAVADSAFAQEAYARFVELGGMGSSETFDFFGFPSRVSQAIADESAERAMVAAVNSAGDWETMKKLVVDTYGSLLGISESSYSDVENEDALFRRMIENRNQNGNYTSQTDVKTGFTTAYNAQKDAEAGSGVGGTTTDTSNGTIGSNQYDGAGVSGGSSYSGGTSTAAPVATISGGGIVIFNDLDSVPWAEESILAMQKEGILSGDGSGSYYPNHSITREEFLKLVMNAIGIPTGGEASHFADVDASAWYYPYIAGAYEAGIVQGISEQEFGIGNNIIRADMAVMLVRAMAYKGIKMEPEKAAFIFSDFADIPAYATESISILAEANLMNGVGNNTFAPAANTTRAEAAVAVHRIFEFIQKGE